LKYSRGEKTVKKAPVKAFFYVSEKVFSFLSQDEIERMKQEEGKCCHIL